MPNDRKFGDDQLNQHFSYGLGRLVRAIRLGPFQTT
jgi:hypothetical protein